MVELLFLVCMSGQPEICEERSLLYIEVSTTACMMDAQPELAKWAESHMGYDIKRWTCRPANFDAKKI